MLIIIQVTGLVLNKRQSPGVLNRTNNLPVLIMKSCTALEHAAN